MSPAETGRPGLVEIFSRGSRARAQRIERQIVALQALDAASRARAVSALDEEAHKLRGAAATVQLSRIEDLAIALENELQNCDPDEPTSRRSVAAAARRLLEPLNALHASEAARP